VSGVALRPVAPSDSAFLEHVYASTRAVELEPMPWTAEQKAAFIAQQFHAQTVHYERHYADASFHVVLVDGEPAGRLIVTRSPERLHIVDIALLGEHRGRGVGTGLLRDLIAEAGERPVSIHVELTNPARSLYERLGFVADGEDGVYMLMKLAQPKMAS
jgi:ribosomal protein S18 acetylase RimI-like enzyme